MCSDVPGLISCGIGVANPGDIGACLGKGYPASILAPYQFTCGVSFLLPHLLMALTCVASLTFALFGAKLDKFSWVMGKIRNSGEFPGLCHMHAHLYPLSSYICINIIIPKPKGSDINYGRGAAKSVWGSQNFGCLLQGGCQNTNRFVSL